MGRKIVAILLAGGLVAADGAAVAQTGQGADAVAPVTIVGVRQPPTEMLPDFDACLKAASDPFTAALIGSVSASCWPAIPPRRSAAFTRLRNSATEKGLVM